ncbi:hypothetical protein BDV36DRAFT_249331 [Aspergillus pseudocaelatus]|uniref:Uncharacterized protein n=1 Tax=Aspergillus pseudocaelatus TaxID=1825620 RepID=A0ABQ6WUA5_9EURO|nr:hypothetical protein BDV36DRAFT_249331 [Aspergillus pseudocaelatus]
MNIYLCFGVVDQSRCLYRYHVHILRLHGHILYYVKFYSSWFIHMLTSYLFFFVCYFSQLFINKILPFNTCPSSMHGPSANSPIP